jgi:hypothetical protein
MEKKKQLATMGKRKRGQLPFLFNKKKIAWCMKTTDNF